MNWMEWQPRIMGEEPENEPSKPTKPGFDGFVGSSSGQSLIIEGLEDRLNKLGISIAIDSKTGMPLLIFSKSDAAAVKDAASSFSIKLTPEQRRQLTADLDYYERLLRR
jgi:hypothetical protein